jgi:integrase
MARKPKNARDGIYQRPDRPGFWMSFADEYGKRRQKKCFSVTMTECKKELASEKTRVDELKKKIADGDAPPEDVTFEAVAGRYIAYQQRRVKARDLSAAELTRQAGIAAQHLVPFFKGMRIAKIRRSTINRYIESRTGEVSAGSILKEANVLKHLFNLACDEWELIPANPAKRLKMPAAPPGRTRHLDAAELAQLFEDCPEWLKPIVGLAVSTGMRRGELMAIRWKDVDHAGARILLSLTKNGRPRFVYLNELSLSVIAALSETPHKPADLLFPGITPAQVTVAFIRTCKKAGIEDCSIHCLRHTYAALCRRNGVDLHTLSKLLGHQDLRMTNRYAHLAPEHLADAAQALNVALPASLIPAKST